MAAKMRTKICLVGVILLLKKSTGERSFTEKDAGPHCLTARKGLKCFVSTVVSRYGTLE
jgi:hypothetical protein